MTGNQLVLVNGTTTQTVKASGSFQFSGTFAKGSSYSVAVQTPPLCPQQTCTVSNGSGTLTANVTNVAVTCMTNTTIALVTTSWGDSALRTTDNIHGLANGATATPLIIKGSNTGIGGVTSEENLTVDHIRQSAYVADSFNSNIKVFNNLLTAQGNIAPNRTITIAGTSTQPLSIGYDSIRDVLYAIGSDAVGPELWVFNSASTVNGTVTPNVTLAAPSGANLVFIDEVNNRLFVGAQTVGAIAVFDTASSITSSSSPSRQISFTGYSSSASLTSIWVDGCTERLYISNNGSSTGGNYGFVFAHADTLSGSVGLDAASVAQTTFSDMLNIAVDDTGALFEWQDSSLTVGIVTGASTLSGSFPVPSTTINAVVDHGYGLSFLAH